VRFIEHALNLTERTKGQVWMLLPSDFDHGITRRHLFAEHPAFAYRVALHSRIKWFEDPDKEKRSDPSTNHAWFGWCWMNQGGARLLYAGKSKKDRAS
jgi:hypothetical protein